MSTKRVNNRRIARLNDFKEVDRLCYKYEKHISFSFEMFCGKSENGEGQDFSEWSKEQLDDLNGKLKLFCAKSVIELMQDGTLAIYDDFPVHSLFVCPKSIPVNDVQWARFRLTGATRIIGFFLRTKPKEYLHNVFYLVFLDQEHHFYPSGKKHT